MLAQQPYLCKKMPMLTKCCSTSACSSKLAYVTSWPLCQWQDEVAACAVTAVRLNTNVALVEDTYTYELVVSAKRGEQAEAG